MARSRMAKNEYRRLCQDDIPVLVTAFAECGWSKPVSIFEQYLQEQQLVERLVWVGYNGKNILGYITLKWQSEYPFFREHDIPEIKDLNVLPAYRKQGAGNAFLDIAEQAAYERSGTVGLAVGLYADYGSAQRIYVKRGYIPDGHGVTYGHQTVPAGENVCLDDDLVLWMVKRKQSA